MSEGNGTSENPYPMTIHKYISHKFYGFAIDPHGTQVFFHLSDFDTAGENVSPIAGEDVHVIVDLKSMNPAQTKAIKADKVIRVREPRQVVGKIDVYYDTRDYGFILGEDGVSYHVHKHEMLDNKYPLVGSQVRFYAGIRQERPRACYVEILE